MGKLKNRFVILGEGPTEFYYFDSLKELFKGLSIRPDYPKHTSIRELDKKISESIALGYSHIFCVIDMDTKNEEPERSLYARLKKKYAKAVDNPKKGIRYEVRFFETHRCTELFFLYYFWYTSRKYTDQETLIKDLNKYVEYVKTTEFFIKCKGLHQYFEKNGGSLDAAITNANHSLDEKAESGRDYTYSALGRLMEVLKEFA